MKKILVPNNTFITSWIDLLSFLGFCVTTKKQQQLSFSKVPFSSSYKFLLKLFYIFFLFIFHFLFICKEEERVSEQQFFPVSFFRVFLFPFLSFFFFSLSFSFSFFIVVFFVFIYFCFSSSFCVSLYFIFSSPLFLVDVLYLFIEIYLFKSGRDYPHNIYSLKI